VYAVINHDTFPRCACQRIRNGGDRHRSASSEAPDPPLVPRAGASVALTAQLERKAAMHSGQNRQPERGRALLAFNLAPVGVQHE
jgi:hypothetical protein